VSLKRYPPHYPRQLIRPGLTRPSRPRGGDPEARQMIVEIGRRLIRIGTRERRNLAPFRPVFRQAEIRALGAYRSIAVAPTADAKESILVNNKNMIGAR